MSSWTGLWLGVEAVATFRLERALDHTQWHQGRTLRGSVAMHLTTGMSDGLLQTLLDALERGAHGVLTFYDLRLSLVVSPHSDYTNSLLRAEHFVDKSMLYVDTS